MNKNSDHVIKTENLSIYYDDNEVIKNISMNVQKGKISAIIGPSGCGKSTLLRSFNRMNDDIENVRQTGTICIAGKNINNSDTDPVVLRRTVGMVFQNPNPFMKSIYKNIIWGPKVNGLKFCPNDLVESCLKKAAVWDELKDRLHTSALLLSGGQQQRLCIARAIALNPDIILMDEPCSSLDPRATAKIEELLLELRGFYTIVIVTHNMHQAFRISDFTYFFYDGQLVESGETAKIFKNPKEEKTSGYVSGRFG